MALGLGSKFSASERNWFAEFRGGHRGAEVREGLGTAPPQ